MKISHAMGVLDKDTRITIAITSLAGEYVLHLDGAGAGISLYMKQEEVGRLYEAIERMVTCRKVRPDSNVGHVLTPTE